MKSMKYFLLVIFIAFAGMNANAQTASKNNKKETIKVLGNCEMCEARIEKAAKVEGVESASWDSKTKLLTLSYDASITNADAVAKKVAAVGHDAGNYKADDKVYNALPACCKYDRTGKTEAAKSSGGEDHSGHNH